jgi:hypothetical protein
MRRRPSPVPRRSPPPTPDGVGRSCRSKRALVSRTPKRDRWFSRISSRIRYEYRDNAPYLFGLIVCSLVVASVDLIGTSLGQDSEPGGASPCA